MLSIVNRMRQNFWLNIFVIGLRYLIGAAFTFASIVKIQGERFTILSPETRIGHFFEAMYQTGMYWQFLGWAQIIAAILLMTQRFAVLGTLIFFPIILNIFILTVSMDFTGTPFITGAMLLSTGFLLIWDYEKFIPLFHPSEGKSNDSLWVALGVLLFVSAIVMKRLSSIATVIGLLAAILIIMFIIIGIKYYRSEKMRPN